MSLLSLTGSLVNAAAIIFGTALGLLFRRFFTEKLDQIVRIGCGVCVIILGIKMAIVFQNVLLVLFSVILGGFVGVLIDLEGRLERNIKRLARTKTEDSGKGFIVTSILFCTGSMAIIGSIESGVQSNHEILFAKAVLDGFICITFAPLYGLGVAFSSISVLLYQGSLTLLATKLHYLSAPEVMNNLSGVGGILLTMIGINMSGIKQIPVGQFLPGILFAMIASYFV